MFIGGAGNSGSGSSSSPRPTSGALPAVSVDAPPPKGAEGPCTKVMGALPITLGTLPGRPARSTSSFVAAWGSPPVVLRCGVSRPKQLRPDSSDFVPAIDGVNYLQEKDGDVNVFTAIDRAVYVEVRVPTSYAAGPLPAISDAIAKVLPAVCVVDPKADPAKLCTRRV